MLYIQLGQIRVYTKLGHAANIKTHLLFERNLDEPRDDTCKSVSLYVALFALYGICSENVVAGAILADFGIFFDSFD